MNEERCTKEKEIDRLTRAVFGGNGEEGTLVRLARIETKLGDVKDTLDEVATTVSGLTREDLKAKAISLLKEKMQLTAQQKTKIWITAIIGATGIAISILTLILTGG